MFYFCEKCETFKSEQHFKEEDEVKICDECADDEVHELEEKETTDSPSVQPTDPLEDIEDEDQPKNETSTQPPSIEADKVVFIDLSEEDEIDLLLGMDDECASDSDDDDDDDHEEHDESQVDDSSSSNSGMKNNLISLSLITYL